MYLGVPADHLSGFPVDVPPEVPAETAEGIPYKIPAKVIQENTLLIISLEIFPKLPQGISLEMVAGVPLGDTL